MGELLRRERKSKRAAFPSAALDIVTVVTIITPAKWKSL
jgi:hypothetical protein